MDKKQKNDPLANSNVEDNVAMPMRVSKELKQKNVAVACESKFLLTVSRPLVTFVIVFFSALYENFQELLRPLSTAYQQAFRPCPCACTGLRLGEMEL